MEIIALKNVYVQSENAYETAIAEVIKPFETKVRNAKSIEEIHEIKKEMRKNIPVEASDRSLEYDLAIANMNTRIRELSGQQVHYLTNK